MRAVEGRQGQVGVGHLMNRLASTLEGDVREGASPEVIRYLSIGAAPRRGSASERVKVRRV